MRAILVMDNEKVTNIRVMVDLREKRLKQKVIDLLENDRAKEAFEILKSKAEIIAYLPRGQKLPGRAEITLFEDML